MAAKQPPAFDAKSEPVPPIVTAPTIAPSGAGGIVGKLERIWEHLRSLNTHGFCPGTLVSTRWGPEKIDAENLTWDASKERSWSKSGGGLRGTTCTPMLSQAVAMLFDRSAEPSTDPDAVYEPYLGDGRRLPYQMSLLLNGNGDYRPGWGPGKSLRYFGLAEKVDPTKLRRGDVIGIQWAKKGAHGVFVWDVHLNAAGLVDCFQMISAIGGYKYGPYTGPEPTPEQKADPKYKPPLGPIIGGAGAGITIGGSGNLVKAKLILKKKDGACYIDPKDGGRPEYVLAPDAAPLFVGKTDEYAAVCSWKALPGVTKADIDLETFRKPSPKSKISIEYDSIGFMECARFHGIGDVPSFATTGAPKAAVVVPAIPGAAPQETSAADAHDPNVRAALPRQPLEQPKDAPLKEQKLLEERLRALYMVHLIATDPGKPDEVMDAKSKAALQEFQMSVGLVASGVPDRATRAALAQAVEDARGRIEGFDAIVARKKRPATKP